MLLRSLFFLLLSLPSVALAEQAFETYSIERAIKSALDNNAEIQTTERGIAIAEQQALEARLRFLPEIGLQALATRYQARRPFSISPGVRSTLLFPSDEDNLFSGQGYLSIALYEGRRTSNTLRLAQTALKQARSNHDVVRLNAIFETKRVFYGFILAQQILGAIEGFKAALPAPAGAAGDPWAALDAESLASELRALEDSARNDLELARLEFLKGLNLELDRPVAIEGKLESTPVDVDLRKALVWATELRPELQSQNFRAQMDAIGVNLALSRRNPTLMLGIDYELVGQEFPLRQNNWDATVGLRIPFAFDFWTQHKQKVAEQRQAEIRSAELRDQVHLEVRKAHQNLQFWQDEWRRCEREYLRLKDLLAQARASGARPPAALRGGAGVLQAQTRYLNASARHILAVAQLERAVGRSLGGP